MFTSAHPPLCPDQPERKRMNMNKEIYERTELDIIKFQTEDVITTSSIDYENHIDLFGTCDLGDATISENSIDYLSAFKSYIEKRHARVYFVAPPLLKDAIACDYSAFDLLRQYEEELIGIPYISDPNDYFFDKSLMFDTIYHCNAEGEVVRTRQLIQDLTNANII